MKVFKFGGGSVKDAWGIRQLDTILRLYPSGTIVVIVSAIGKTTNHLEAVLDAFYCKKQAELDTLLCELEDKHFAILAELNGDDKLRVKLQAIFQELRATLKKESTENYDYDYDRIICYGELLSTTLVSGFLEMQSLPNRWLDARKLIRTDNTYREGRVDWKITTPKIRNTVNKIFHAGKERVIVTQGFIGGTAETHTTTLGREGSDYTAAIFAYAANADSVTIWKDVPGFFNADPKLFPGAVKLEKIPYEEAIELSYYGANIIHPKTLKPLQNKQIPLHVKSFFDPELPGTVISSEKLKKFTPSFIFKGNQMLITIFPKDFSFIAVDNLSEIFSILSKYRIKINLMQNSALSFSICVDNVQKRIEQVLLELKSTYRIKYNDKVELATIRHYQEDSLKQILKDKTILVEQKDRTTIQLVLKKRKRS